VFSSGGVKMSGSGEPEVSRVRSTSDIDFVFPSGFSFFEPYLQYFVREILGIDGEAYVSKTSAGVVSGMFLYDDSEKSGTIYTRSRKVFDYFYRLRPFDFLFAEMKTEHESEVYDIYTVDVGSLAIDHRFSHEISIRGTEDACEIEQFVASTHPGANKKWVGVALDDGDKCFIVRLGKEIAGLGWLSIVDDIGRLHSLYVKPQYRRIGIGEDVLYARLLWLKSKGAYSAFSEISRHNSPSSRIALKGQMTASGQIFQYFRKNQDKKVEPRRSVRFWERRRRDRPEQSSRSALHNICTSP
jgi:GNAT superfamily N-acetyltransferase